MDKRIGWALGLGALAAGAFGLMAWTAKNAQAKTGGFNQLPVKPGNQTAALNKGGTIDIIVPVGSTPIGAEASPNVFSPEPSPAPLTFRFSAFAAGQGAINVAWQDASGARQDAFVTVNVS
jgi:hypothetical protein